MRKVTIQAKVTRTTVNLGLPFRRSTACLGFLMASLLISGPVTAWELTSKGAPQGTPAEPAQETPKLRIPPDPTRAYLEAIDRIESERGPYVAELSDLYLGLGEALMKAGEFESARDAYHRGVMVVRVNSGPNSPEQTNLLYLIANIETLLGEPRRAEAVMETILFINTQNYGEHSARLLPVYERVYEWYQMARPLGSDAAQFSDHERIIGLSEKMVEISAAGDQAPDSAIAFRRLGEAHFQTVRYLLDVGPPYVTLDGWVPVRTGTLESPGVVEVSIRAHFLAGRNAFRNYIELLKSDDSKTPLERAEALADTGDWYLAVSEMRQAWDLYRQAYQELADDEEHAELAESYMGQPKPVHFFNGQLGLPEDALLDSQEVSLDISMTVTRRGDVRYVEILNAPDSMSEAALGEITNQLRLTPFRPAMKAGQIVTTEAFIWQHVIQPPVQDVLQAEEATS